MSDRTVGPGEVIYRAGDTADLAYVIQSGEARLDIEREGLTVSIRLGPGDFLGDGPALFDQRPSAPADGYRATAVAVDEVTLLEVPHALLRDEVQAASPLLRGWIASFADRALQLVEASLDAARDRR